MDSQFSIMKQDMKFHSPQSRRQNSKELQTTKETELLNYIIEEILFQETNSQIIYFLEGQQIRSI